MFYILTCENIKSIDIEITRFNKKTSILNVRRKCEADRDH